MHHLLGSTLEYITPILQGEDCTNYALQLNVHSSSEFRFIILEYIACQFAGYIDHHIEYKAISLFGRYDFFRVDLFMELFSGGQPTSDWNSF